MDLKDTLQNFLKPAENRYIDSWLLLASGVLGMVIMVAAVWLAFDDLRSGRTVLQVAAHGQAVVDQLARPVQALKRVMNDEQVQSLAARAIEAPDAVEDLRSHLNGRINKISEVRVFGSSLASVDPSELGLNGYAVLDMLLHLQENKRPQLQYHNSLVPPRMVNAVQIMSGDDLVGYMVVTLEPDYVLAHFNPDYSLLGHISLSQYNGRQAPNILAELGDLSLAREVPERQSVPGTLFRIEFPLQQHIAFLSGKGLLLAFFLAGVFFLAGATLLHLNNRKFAQAKPAARKGAATVPAVRPDFKKPAARVIAAAPRAEGEQIGDAPEVNDAESEPPPMRLRYDIAERRRAQEADHQPLDLTAGIFRAYDIRGVIGKTLDAQIARQVGQVVGTVVLERNAGPAVVARDGRLSGPYLLDAMIEGITSTGCDVLNIGAVPTGVLYYAAHERAAGSGVMITGSHNPPDYNGFKIMVGGDPIHGKELSDFYRRITEGDVQAGSGIVQQENVLPQYIERIAQDIQLEKPLKVVIDCGNGIGGVCAADVLRAIGAEVLPLYDEVDGTFPNHHPDPSEPENLIDLIESVRLIDADLGFALDGDADRLGVVTLAGDIIYADRVMMLLAMDVLDRNPGATIIYDVKCTGHLAEVIRQAGGNPLMYKTGHSLIKAKMKEISSPFAGEMSGHFFFKDRWYGVDDGIYAAARLLEILAASETPPEAIFNALPSSYSTPELKVQMEEGENFTFVEAFKKAAHFDGASINTIDGIRADWPDGWGLVRGSNTTPSLVLRFDAETEEALGRIKTAFRSQMLGVKPDLQLPF
ncbi:MAG: phosphomannomutase/phosphoglucomutase [Xanthomonadales bacterium]